MNEFIKKTDQDVYEIMVAEEKRQKEGLELIPSENYVSRAVLDALGSCFTNKYSEGYPGKRYYGGQEFTDQVELLAIERAKELFGAQHANVQPLSGAMANISMYFGLLSPGDTILGMELSHGGHLTHGHPVTYISKIFNFVRYGMKDVKTGEIDYEDLYNKALKIKPKMILVGFSSYSRSIDYRKVLSIAREVGALAVADVAHIAGLIAGGVLENPLTCGFDVLSMTTHKTLRGPRGGMIVSNSEELAKKIDKAVFPGLQGGPHMNVIAAKAASFKEALHPKFKEYAKQVLKNAKAMERVFHKRGLKMVAGGTDNHLILLDVWMDGSGISGKEAEEILDKVGLTANKNVIPDDKRSPLDPSGLRLGTPAITTRGITENDSEEIAHAISDLLLNKELDLAPINLKVRGLSENHPIPEYHI